MSDYDRLRRGAYQADGAARAARQEADELSRGSFHPDARAKAAEQEAYEQRQAQAARRRREAADAPRRADHDPSRRRASRDRAGHTVVRRTIPHGGEAARGGAVVSRRSGLAQALRRLSRRDSSTGRTAARKRRRWERAQRREERRGQGGRVALVALLALVAAFCLLVCRPIDRSIAFSADERAGLSRELSWHVPGLPHYVLALGSDAREGETFSRTDTMILVRVDPLGGKLTMLSIPRDTMVQIEGQGTQKINAAYAFGGVAGAVHAVHELTGAPISHVAVVRFDGVESLVDYLGGVSVDVPVPVYDPQYTGLVLDAGTQQMDGHTALLFSRVRHGFELGDYQRQKDQRILMQAIMDKVLGLPPWELPGVVGHMGGMLGTTMRTGGLLPLLLRLKVSGATVYQATVPSSTAMVDGISYVIADEAALAQMMEVIDAGGDPAALM